MAEPLVAGSLEDLQASGHLIVAGERGEILVLVVEGELYALDARCPHMGSLLARGDIEDGRVVCPWHGATFDLATGASNVLFADSISCFSIEVRAGLVLVDPHPKGAATC